MIRSDGQEGIKGAAQPPSDSVWDQRDAHRSH